MSNDLRKLLLDAFAMAERQGKPDWRRMNIGVLKNRLMNLTRGGFSEQSYGKSRFRELVEEFPDLLLIDDSTVPAGVVLLDRGEKLPQRESAQNRKRIRPDLWKALFDYSSGIRYVWDANGLARPSQPNETGGETVPTLSQAELTQWRGDFANRVAQTLGPVDRARVDEWQAKGLGTAALPMHLRGSWNQELTRRAEQRLADWFATIGSQPEIASAVPIAPSYTDLEELRNLITGCIELMTKEELERLQLPAVVIMRYRNKPFEQSGR